MNKMKSAYWSSEVNHFGESEAVVGTNVAEPKGIFTAAENEDKALL
jgi:hypothetical protein